MRASLVRAGFLKRNLDQLSSAAGRALSVGGLAGPVPDLEIYSFRNPTTAANTKVFTDGGFGGFSVAKMESVTSSGDSPDEPPVYGRFSGTISIDLPKNRPDIERSGFAAWRMPDPGWTILGKALYNVEPYSFLAMRVKADQSRYFVNLQVDSMVQSDLFQHRLFAKTPGKWETLYIPFSEFVKTHMGKVLKSQGHMPKNSMTTVGMGLIDRIPGPFELCIDCVWATNNRDLDALEDEDSVE